MPRVKHVNDLKEPDDVYVGRPTKWGNPFTHLPSESTRAIYQVETREQAVEAYENWIISHENLLNDLQELKGKNLVCWCHPKRCHAEVLLRLANEL